MQNYRYFIIFNALSKFYFYKGWCEISLSMKRLAQINDSDKVHSIPKFDFYKINIQK